MTPILPLPSDAALKTPFSSDFLPQSRLDVRKENATTIPGGLAQKQGSDLQAKTNDDTSENDSGMSQTSPMTTAMIMPGFGTNNSTEINLLYEYQVFH